MEQSVSLIIAKIEELILAAGGGVRVYYPYVVRQVILEPLLSLIGFVMASIVCAIGFKTGCKNKWDDNTVIGFVAVVTVFIGAIGMLVGLVGFLFSLSQLLNPHYHAVERIISMGTSLIK